MDATNGHPSYARAEFQFVLREANECERLSGESVGVEALDKFAKICQQDL